VPFDNNIKYSPIAAGAWTGTTGVYQPIGGTWDAINRQFTASDVQPGTSGKEVDIDLKSIQRILVNDSASGGTGWSVGASFVTAADPKTIAFTATAISGPALDALETAAGENNPVASAWNFSTSNYNVNSTNPVYLSLKVGLLSDSDVLQLWHYDESNWAKFLATDLTYDGLYASFTANSFSDYAITVPEPSMLVLMAIAFLGHLAFAWRKVFAYFGK
jgi:hypothetical protein